MKKVFGYARCSSDTNAGGDTFNRQSDAIRSWAKTAKAKVVEVFEEVITGTTADRPIFTGMLSRMAQEGINSFVIENQSRLGRDLLVNLHLISSCKKLGISIIDASTGDDLTQLEDPMMVAMHQISGVFAQLDKSMIVSKLKKARDAKSKELGKRCEGRKKSPFSSDLILKIKKLRRKPHHGKRISLEKIAEFLNKDGNRTPTGGKFHATTVKRILTS